MAEEESEPTLGLLDDFVTGEAPPQPVEYRYGFRIGHLNLLHDGSTVVEVIPPEKITPLPNVPNWLLGLTNVRSNLIPLFDLARYLTLESLEGTRSRNLRQLVFGSQQRMASILIDGLPLQLKLGQGAEIGSAISSHPLLEPYTLGTYQIDNQLWTQINFDGLFAGMGDSLTDSQI